MKRDDVLRLVSLGETPWIEIKQSLGDPHKIGETISAVANAAALADEPHGFIIWGFRSSDSVEVGTEFSPEMKVGGEPLKLHLERNLTPRVGIDWWTFDGPPAHLVVLRVAAPRLEPLAYKKRRFCRVGAHNQSLSTYPNIERELWAKLSKDRPENDVAYEQVHDTELEKLLDLDTAARLLAIDRQTVIRALLSMDALKQLMPGRYDVPISTAFALARSFEGLPRVARHAPNVVIYRGTDRRHGEKSQRGSRGIALGFDGLLAWVSKALPVREAYVGGRRVLRHIPEIVVRELLMNALVHQDFGATGAGPLIEVFSDRLEVSNPGRPLESDVRRLLDMNPQSRNENLATLLNRLGFVEERGSGIDKAVFELEEAHLTAPSFEATEHGLRVTVYGPQEFPEISRRERLSTIYYHAVVKYLSTQRAPINNRSVRARFGLGDQDTTTVSRLLRGALEGGWIREDEGSGAGRSQSYLPFWAGP